MIEGHVGIFGLVNGGHHFVPQNAGLHHIAFFHRRHPVLTGPRQFEGNAGNALDLERVVDLGIDGPLLAIAEIDDLLRFTEIDAAGQLADDQDVETFDQILFQRGRSRQSRVTDRRPQVCKQLKLLAQPQQPGFRTYIIGNTVPFRTTDSAEQHRIRCQRRFHIGIGNRLAMRVIGGAADQTFRDDETAAEGFVHVADQLADLVHGFRADPVTGQEKQRTRCHVEKPFAGKQGRSYWTVPAGARRKTAEAVRCGSLRSAAGRSAPV